MPPVTNAHSHVFTGQCAPDFFLRTGLPKALDPYAPRINAFLAKPGIRAVVRQWAKLRGDGRLQRFIQFADMGLHETQERIFREMRKAYSPFGPEVRFIALTMNMDHMGPWSSSHGRIADQLAEVERLRMHYPDVFFPFVGVDPRHLGGQELVDWVAEKVERRAFFGIKLYPSLGFFPFDKRLDALYAWAEQHQVPIMTHCTRHGVYYLGRMADVLLDLKPEGLNPAGTDMSGIHKRIARFRNAKLTWENTEYGCNIFTHPQNYRPVLEKYPRLKLCLAHFGGDDEMLGRKQKVHAGGLDTDNWYLEVVRLLQDQRWPNVYTDISYTLYNPDVYGRLHAHIDGPEGDRILFGTDFYMTLKETTEENLLQRCVEGLEMERFKKVAGENTERYLQNAMPI